MKKVILLACSMILFVGTIFAQKIRFERNEVDEFTGNRIIQTYSINLSHNNGNTFHVRFCYIDGITCINLICHLFTPFAINEGNVLYLKFEDGEIKKLLAVDNAVCTYNVGTNTIPYTTVASYMVNVDLLQYFSDNILIKIRCDTSDGFVEKDVRSKSAKYFKIYAKGFLENIPN